MAGVARVCDLPLVSSVVGVRKLFGDERESGKSEPNLWDLSP